MKTAVLILFFICFTSFVYSQTPYFSIKFRLEEIMYHGDTCNSTYTISIERCKFYEAEIKYTHDTSQLDWKNLPGDIIRDLRCKVISNYSNKSYITDYKFQNHDFIYESIIKINIFREKCGKLDTMIISFPIKISSFVTFVDFKTLYFYPGKYDLTDDMVYGMDENHLIIKPKENVLPK
jgi:hypothetical protein